MSDYTLDANGRAPTYPAEHWGTHYVKERCTILHTANLSAMSANDLAVPSRTISVLTSSPLTVPDAFFGMSIKDRVNDATTGLTFKSTRTHDLGDGKGRWQFIETSDNVWDFSVMDQFVNYHYAAGRDIIYTFFGTPGWASARASEHNAYAYGTYGSGTYGNFGIAAEPTDMAKWDRYCTTVATRYLGKIKYYEIWNEPNVNNNGAGPTSVGADVFFSGTWAKLSEMTRRANQKIKLVDPTAKIISPPITIWYNAQASTYFDGMMAAASTGADGGGTSAMKNWIDIVGVHMYWPGPTRTQDLAAMVDSINTCKTTAGISAKETWDTESAPIGTGDITLLPPEEGAKVLQRYMLTLAAKGISRTFFYQFDHASMGFKDIPQAIAAREAIITKMKSGTILGVLRWEDGRVGYWDSGGVTII